MGRRQVIISPKLMEMNEDTQKAAPPLGNANFALNFS